MAARTLGRGPVGHFSLIPETGSTQTHLKVKLAISHNLTSSMSTTSYLHLCPNSVSILIYIRAAFASQSSNLQTTQQSTSTLTQKIRKCQKQCPSLSPSPTPPTPPPHHQARHPPLLPPPSPHKPFRRPPPA